MKTLIALLLLIPSLSWAETWCKNHDDGRIWKNNKSEWCGWTADKIDKPKFKIVIEKSDSDFLNNERLRKEANELTYYYQQRLDRALDNININNFRDKDCGERSAEALDYDLSDPVNSIKTSFQGQSEKFCEKNNIPYGQCYSFAEDGWVYEKAFFPMLNKMRQEFNTKCSYKSGALQQKKWNIEIEKKLREEDNKKKNNAGGYCKQWLITKHLAICIKD